MNMRNLLNKRKHGSTAMLKGNEMKGEEKDGVDFVLLFIEIVANIVVILLLYLFFRILTFKYL